jgi:hypothetical protein
MIHGSVRVSVVTVAACLIAARLVTDISPESLTGVAIGLFAWVLMLLSVWVGRHQGLRRAPMNPGEAVTRDLHMPIGLLTLVAVMVHWHPRWRNLPGVLSMGLMWVVVLSLALPGLRRIPGMQRVHRYGAHLLVAVATLHGILTLFFVQN